MRRLDRQLGSQTINNDYRYFISDWGTQFEEKRYDRLIDIPQDQTLIISYEK